MGVVEGCHAYWGKDSSCHGYLCPAIHEWSLKTMFAFTHHPNSIRKLEKKKTFVSNSINNAPQFSIKL
jgi:hypothetical protein